MIKDELRHLKPNTPEYHRINRALSVMAITSSDEARIIRSRFLDGVPHAKLAEEYHISEPRLYARLRQATEKLSQVIDTLEDAPYSQNLLDLPRPKLFGADEQAKNLTKSIINADGFLSVEGVGGIGKTALVYKALHDARLIKQFEDFVYVSLKDRPPSETDIDRLRASTIMLIIDDVDVETASTLVSLLRQGVNPSKVIFICRRRIPDVDIFTLNDIDRESAFDFACHLIESKHIEPGLIDDRTIRQIYSAVGGHPLALEAMIKRCHVSPPDWALTELAQNTEYTKTLYERIYTTPLSSPAQWLLSAFVMLKGQGDAESLMELARFRTTADFADTIQELVDACMVTISGSSKKRVYTISKLSMTYAWTFE